MKGLEALLVQRNKAVQHMGGMWVFPGGKVDQADYPEDGDQYTAALNAAIRETREEAGLEVDPGQLVYQSHWTTPEGAKRRFSTWFFLTTTPGNWSTSPTGPRLKGQKDAFPPGFSSPFSRMARR
jgi:8-oxo-dGTP pyrophosphatase MutT (NUDIX family)